MGRYRFLERDRDVITVDLPGQGPVKYQILQLMDFTSERKRMSVICRGPDGPSVRPRGALRRLA